MVFAESEREELGVPPHGLSGGEGGCLFKNDDSLETKSILVDLTIINPSANTLHNRSVLRVEPLRYPQAASMEEQQYMGGTLPDIYRFPPSSAYPLKVRRDRSGSAEVHQSVSGGGTRRVSVDISTTMKGRRRPPYGERG